MQKVILVLSLIANCILIFLLVKQPDYSEKLNSIESQLSNVTTKRDSIKLEIDTTIIKIKENETYYKETVNNIIHYNVDSDYIFFCNYLQRYSNINYSDTIKAN